MKRANFVCIVLIVLMTSLGFASQGGGASVHAPPVFDKAAMMRIIYQCFNVGLLLYGAYRLLKKPAIQYFKTKRESFLKIAEQSQKVEHVAAQEHQHVQVKLTKLENSLEESILKAKAEAADMKLQLIAEAKTLSQKIKEEAELSTQLEVEKAKVHLKEHLIRESISLAKKNFSKIDGENVKKLQQSFVNHIQAGEQ